MPRFTETDQSASLLQQILNLSPDVNPPAPSADAVTGADWSELEDDLPTTLAAAPASRHQASPPLNETVVRELVATRAGQVQLTLRVSAGEPIRFDGETVGRFFRRVVRPLSSSDQSSV